MEDKNISVSETIRLIKVNHLINEDNIHLLGDVFDKGYANGKLRKIMGSSHMNHPSIKGFDLEKFLENIVDKLDPKRFQNNRNLVYSGTEIESSSILVCDFSFQKSLNLMKQNDTEYYGFDYERCDEKYHNDALKYAKENYDDDEVKFTINYYNKSEVNILMVKLYQVGYSLGCDNTIEIDPDISMIYSMLKSFKGGVPGDMVSYMNKLKEENPTWGEYEEYFIY